MQELIEEKVREYIEEHGEEKAWDVLNLIKLDKDQFDLALQLLRNGEDTISEEQIATLIGESVFVVQCLRKYALPLLSK